MHRPFTALALLLPWALAADTTKPSCKPTSTTSSSGGSPTGSNTPIPSLAVDTSSGLFTGFVNASTPDVNIWLGIPYGTPPVGNLRFLPPLPATYHGAVDATQYPNICWQDSALNTSVFWLLTTPFQNTDPQSEDCLYANIWAPRKPVAPKVPVLIWVCGGGFNEGGGHAPYQVPDHWIQRMQTHIVVTFNYRLNIFGFPGARASPWNVGLMDIRLLVEWVYANIEGFGGDRERITLWGQSAGAGAVDAYSYAHPDDTMVAGFIADSGSVGLTTGAAPGGFSTFAGFVGCGNLSAADELACMQKVDPKTFQNILEPASENHNSSVPTFGAMPDNITWFDNFTQRMEDGLVSKSPMIAGNNINEGAAFAPFTLNETAPPNSSVTSQFLTFLACTTENEVNARVSHGLTTFRYLFAGNFSNITPRYWLGAMHSSELPLVFGTHFEFNGNSTEFEYETSYTMEALWVAFLNNPNVDLSDGKGLSWPKYKVNGTMILFGNDSRTDQLVPGSYYDGVYQCPKNGSFNLGG